MIIPIQPEEVAELRQLAMTTFRETFGHDNTEEQLQAYFETDLSESVLRAELANSESGWYFASVDGKNIGFLKVNWGQAQTEQELEKGFEIQRLYVLKAYQGYGLGKALFEHALDLAHQSGCDWAWLGVWEHNDKAQAFYKKYGFEKFAEHQFPVGDKIDIDWLLKKALK